MSFSLSYSISLWLMGKRIAPRDIANALRADGLSTLLGGVLNSFPYTCFAQNVGLVRLTRVKSRWVVTAAGVFMIFLGLLPKSFSPTSQIAVTAVLALLMMNLVHVQPGEAIFQPARLPHAYLHGCNVELMANSDNVLRGGLTSKHVDVNELLAVVDVVPVTPLPVAQQALTPGVTRYQLPTDEFHLLRLSCHGGGTLPVLPAVGIALNIGEACVVQLAKRDYPLQQGESVLLPAGQSVVVSGESVDLFVAW